MIPTSTNVTVDVSSKVPANSDAVAVFLHKQAGVKHPEMSRLPIDLRDTVEQLQHAGAVSGKSQELTMQLLSGKPARRLMVVGLGNIAVFSADCLREAGAVVARAARKHGLHKVALIVPPLPETMPGRPGAPSAGAGRDVGVDALATGLMLASFDWAEYRGKAAKKTTDDKPIAFTLIVPDGDLKTSRQVVERAVTIADGQNFARTIAFRPGNEINPPALAEVAKKFAKEVGLTCRVLDEKEMEKLGMGGIVAVGAGSNRTPPRMIVLEHKGSGFGVQGSGKGKRNSSLNPEPRTLNPPPLLIVGKGITYDTGGLSIKPTASMRDMVFDKCGAMTVLGLMYAAAKLKLPINLVGILAAAENHISETSYRPGDLLRMYNGVTVEVADTDAEGRLVLADALAWGIEQYKPAAVVDLATLTGGVVVALGTFWCGLMSNDDTLAAEITLSADRTGEKVWRLPMGEEVREMIQGTFADIVNLAGKYASPLQGAAFLSHFIPENGKTPWVHLDIAGVADTEKPLTLYNKGATGWGVRTLVDWVTSRIEKRARL